MIFLSFFASNHPSKYFSSIFLLNKVIISQIFFEFYFVFCVIVILSMFGLLLCYRRLIHVWFVAVLSTFDLLSFYRRGVVGRLVATFYLSESNLNR